MYMMFSGFAISLGYGSLASLLLYFVNGANDTEQFLKAYTSSFNTLVSLGLILGTALIVGRTQRLIPDRIEQAFKPEELAGTRYQHYKELFENRRRSIIWSSELGLASFLIFLLCKFPLPMLAENLMILAACAEYVFGVYIGRKIFYAGLMLHSILEVKIARNLFKDRELDEIDWYVNLASTLTLIFGYIHLHNYYYGPFSFKGPLGPSARILLLLPVVLGTPVLLIFNFYPRFVLRRIYSRSIDVEVVKLKRKLKNQSLSAFERLSYLVEFERQYRDELRNRMRLSLSDLPVGITIIIMVLKSFLGK